MPPPPKKSKVGLFLGLGCGCLLLLATCIGTGIYFVRGIGPGEEVVGVPITLGRPFSLSYIQDGSQKYDTWLEVDLNHTSSFRLDGRILLSRPSGAFGQYILAATGSGSPIVERNSSTRVNWTSTGSSTSGTVSLFPIPAQTSGETVTLSGTVTAPPGTNGTIRLFVAERD